MYNRVSKTQFRRSHTRVKLSRSLQQQLLNAVARQGANPAEAGLLQATPARILHDKPAGASPLQVTPASLLHDIPAGAGLLQDTPTNFLPATQAGANALQNSSADFLCHPKPKHPYVSFLKKFVDPFDLYPPRANCKRPFILKWLASVGTDRDTHSRSDSYLYHTINRPIPQRLTRSVPAMSSIDENDGFGVPPIPPSTQLHSPTDADTTDADTIAIVPSNNTKYGSSRKSLVEDEDYRRCNLVKNRIFLYSSRKPYPEEIDKLIKLVGQNRDSSGPSIDDVWRDEELESLGLDAGEADVEEYFRREIFTFRNLGSLQRQKKRPMSSHAIPNRGMSLRVSKPWPDLLYGYNWDTAFHQQQVQLHSMHKVEKITANSQHLLYPFFLVEFKGGTPSAGPKLWVATNQCLGGSASCVNLAERLQDRLRKCQYSKVELSSTAAFSIAMSGTEARLFITWKHDRRDYYMMNIKNFALQEPVQYIEFRKYVLNILDWGQSKRLEEIRTSLDTLLDERRKRKSARAKSHPPPSVSSASSSSSRRRAGPSKRGRPAQRGRPSKRSRPSQRGRPSKRGRPSQRSRPSQRGKPCKPCTLPPGDTVNDS